MKRKRTSAKRPKFTDYGVFDPSVLHMKQDGPDDKFRWCLHCERAYPTGSFRVSATCELQLCPYGECDGDAFIDSWRWRKVLEANPTYPITPLLGVYYGLYGPKEK